MHCDALRVYDLPNERLLHEWGIHTNFREATPGYLCDGLVFLLWFVLPAGIPKRLAFPQVDI